VNILIFTLLPLRVANALEVIIMNILSLLLLRVFVPALEVIIRNSLIFVEVGEGAKCPGNNFRYFGEVLRTKLELVRKEEGGRRWGTGGGGRRR
jgi:hypothetical protein